MSLKAVVIGASSGAVEALFGIFSEVKKKLPVPVIIVVHVPANKKSVLSQIYQGKYRGPVKEVDDKERLERGTIYFAPPDYHVLIETDHRLSLSSEETVNYSRPSIDVLFESAADVFGEGLIGIILTGANHDGAMGAKTIYDNGGLVLIQDPDEAKSDTMPRAALAACPDATVKRLAEIADFLNQL